RRRSLPPGSMERVGRIPMSIVSIPVPRTWSVESRGRDQDHPNDEIRDRMSATVGTPLAWRVCTLSKCKLISLFVDRERRRRPSRRVPLVEHTGIELLDRRVLPAVTAALAPDGTLRVVGDELDNTIVVSRDAAGTILINNGAVPLRGATVA